MVQVLSKSDLKHASLCKNSRYWKVKSLAHTQSQVKLIQVNLMEYNLSSMYTLPLTPAHARKHPNENECRCAGLFAHTKHELNLLDENEPVTSNATACPYNDLEIHWSRYVLRSNASLQYSIYGYTLHEQIHTYAPTPTSQVRPGRAEFCMKACVWWSRSPRSWCWVWAPASRSPRDNAPARPGTHPRSPSETTGTFRKCHRCFDFPPPGSRAGHAERGHKISAFFICIGKKKQN